MVHVSADLPVIDLTSPDIGATTKSIRQALMDHGFFYVINHGIDDALIKGVYAESKKFFEQPMEEKMALLMNSSHRGYVPPDFEGFEPDANGKGDLLECFHMFGSGVDSESKNDVNQWPPAERFPSWKETMKSYHECAMYASSPAAALGGAPWRRTCFPGTRGSVDPRRAVFPGRLLRGDGPVMYRSWKMQVALTSSMVVAVQGGGSSEPSGVDFPSVQGILPFQGLGEVVRRRAGVTFSFPSPASRSRRK